MSNELVVMPKSDWEDILTSVRNKTGKTDLMTSDQVSTEVDGIEGGVSMHPSDCRYLFINGARLEWLDKIVTSGVTAFNSMFASCQTITTVPWFDTSKGTDFDSMFSNCSAFASLSSPVTKS